MQNAAVSQIRSQKGEQKNAFSTRRNYTKAMWTCERFVTSRKAQRAVYYNALVPVHTYLSI